MFLLCFRILGICLLLSIYSPASMASGGEGGGKTNSLYFAMDKPFVVNLTNTSGLTYLQVNVQFKLKKVDLRKALQDQLPAVENAMVMLLSDQTPESIKSVKGKLALQKSALKSVQQVCEKLIGSPVVDDVYFTGFIIQ